MQGFAMFLRECLVAHTSRCSEVGECADAQIPRPGERVAGACRSDDDPCGSFVIAPLHYVREPAEFEWSQSCSRRQSSLASRARLSASRKIASRPNVSANCSGV